MEWVNDPKIPKNEWFPCEKRMLKAILSRQKKELVEELEDILENKVRVYAKINFCEECRKQPALKKNELIMYFEKDLDQAIKTIKKI